VPEEEKSELQPEPEPQSQPEPEPQPEPEAQPQPEPEPVPVPQPKPQGIIIPLVKRVKESPKVNIAPPEPEAENPTNQPVDSSKPEEVLAPTRRGGRRREAAKVTAEVAAVKDEEKPPESKIENEPSSVLMSPIQVRVENLDLPTLESPTRDTVRLPQLSPQDEAKLKPAASSVVLQQLSPKQLSPIRPSLDLDAAVVEPAKPEPVATSSYLTSALETVPLKKRRGRLARKSESEQAMEVLQRPEKMEPQMSPNSRRGRSASIVVQATAVETIFDLVVPEPAKEHVPEEPKPIFPVLPNISNEVKKVVTTPGIGFRMENILRMDVVEVKPSAPPEVIQPEVIQPETTPKQEVTPKSRNRRKGNPKKIVEVKYDELDDLSDLDESPPRPAISKLDHSTLITLKKSKLVKNDS
jgi:hypothetical protein